MKVKCHNCDKTSPDVSPEEADWKLVRVHKWSATSKTTLNHSNWIKGETLDQALERIGKNWFCPDCFIVNMDNVFGVMARTLSNRN